MFAATDIEFHFFSGTVVFSGLTSGNLTR